MKKKNKNKILGTNELALGELARANNSIQASHAKLGDFWVKKQEKRIGKHRKRYSTWHNELFQLKILLLFGSWIGIEN